MFLVLTFEIDIVMILPLNQVLVPFPPSLISPCCNGPFVLQASGYHARKRTIQALKVADRYDFVFLWTRIKRKKIRGFVCFCFVHVTISFSNFIYLVLHCAEACVAGPWGDGARRSVFKFSRCLPRWPGVALRKALNFPGICFIFCKIDGVIRMLLICLMLQCYNLSPHVGQSRGLSEPQFPHYWAVLCKGVLKIK